jgi:4-hydroxysphinganine ceramide fatty acyl 2-hydroxylase
MPPTLFIVLAYPWYCLAHTLFAYHTALAVYSGGIAGYISYDMTHYFLHHKTYFLPARD